MASPIATCVSTKKMTPDSTADRARRGDSCRCRLRRRSLGTATEVAGASILPIVCMPWLFPRDHSRPAAEERGDRFSGEALAEDGGATREQVVGVNEVPL